MNTLNLVDIVKGIKAKKFSPKEITKFYLERIEKHNPKLYAYITINKDVLKESESIKDFDKPLSGVPLGIKDVFCTQGLKTTAGSKMLKNFIPPYSATVVDRLKDAGALILGKCNNDEFAMGSTGETSYFGCSKNPWDTDRTSGGSSGGSATAVSARLCAGSLGTDTGGSIRLPSAFCHLVGIKPTYGRVSRYGIVAYASSLDQAGTLTQTVEDGALILDAISGKDEKDFTTKNEGPTNFFKNLNKNIKDLKIAYFDYEKIISYKGDIQINQDIIEAQKRVLEIFKSEGCSLVQKECPLYEHGLSVYYLISGSEARSNLSRYDGIRYGFRSDKNVKNIKDFYKKNRSEGFGKEVKSRILTGSFCLSSGYYDDYFQRACRVRRIIKEGFEEIFKTCDVIISPSSFSPAPLLEKNRDFLVENYFNDQFLIFANLAGLPAMNLPVGFSKKENLPVGVQIMAPAFQEQKMLDVAFCLENILQVKEKRPGNF